MEQVVSDFRLAPLSVRVGRWWFQRRSLSPIPLFLLLIFLNPTQQLHSWWYVMAITGILLGEGLRIWAVGYAGSRTRTRGDVVEQLVHAGPYRFVRNPLYIANIVLYTCVGVLFGFSYLSILIFVYSVVQYSFIIRFEEQVLLQTFGKAYSDYCKAVPRWFIRVIPYTASGHEFHLLNALRSERSTFYSITAMAVLLVLKKSLR